MLRAFWAVVLATIASGTILANAQPLNANGESALYLKEQATVNIALVINTQDGEQVLLTQATNIAALKKEQEQTNSLSSALIVNGMDTKWSGGVRQQGLKFKPDKVIKRINVGPVLLAGSSG